MNVLSHNDFCSRFIQINFLDYASLVTSLPTEWRHVLSTLQERPPGGAPELFYLIITNPKTCRLAYKCFIESLTIAKPHELKWIDKGINIIDHKWREYNSLPFKCTLSTKLHAFQYKITHRILGTGSFKKLCNIVDDDTCTFCAEAEETLLHLFVECPIIQGFWEEIKSWINNSTGIDILNTTDPNILLFGDVRSLLATHVLLTAKYYIFICQLRKTRPCLLSFKQMLITEYKTEKYISKQSKKKSINFENKWRPIEDLLTA